MNGDWRDAAACQYTDPDVFFPTKGQVGKEAKRICARCKVRAQCLAWAMALPEQPQGVWGGLNQRERNSVHAQLATADAKPHGTLAAYRRHLRHGETACESCLQALRRDWEDRASAANARRNAQRHERRTAA
jgi:WhiB family redox-sensing transcriptional regulator